MRTEFESANSHYPIHFRNTFLLMRIRLIRIRLELNCRVHIYYCKSELSEEVLGRNFVGIKKSINISMCKLSLGFSFLLLLTYDLI
jgi:hypothetical protein